MALSSKGVVITVPVLVLSISVAAVFLFFLLSSLSSCSCPASTSVGGDVGSGGGGADGGGGGSWRFEGRISTSSEDVEWVKDQIKANGLRMQDNVLRKGINPRTRQQQLQDLIAYFLSLAHSLISLNMRVCFCIYICIA